jgi:hypothetical protein
VDEGGRRRGRGVGGHALGGGGEGEVEEESFSDGMLLAWPSGPVVLMTCDLNPLRCVTKPRYMTKPRCVARRAHDVRPQPSQVRN